MIVTVNSQQLLVELRLISKVVPTKHAIQILTHVLLTADGNALKLFATDTEVGLFTACSGEVQAAGTITVPAGKFLAMVEQFPDLPVKLTLDRQLVVQCGGFTSRMQAQAATDYSATPPTIEGTSRHLAAEQLKQLIARTRYAVNAEHSKSILRGALLTCLDDKTIMASVDGRRLAVAYAKSENTDNQSYEAIIPAKILDILDGMLEKGPIEIINGAQHLFFTLKNRVFFSRVLDGAYPNYQQIIPHDNDKQVVLNRNQFASIMRRVLVAAEDSGSVYFSISQGALQISSISAEFGTADEIMPIMYDGLPLKVCINGKHVLNFLDSTAHEAVTMALRDADRNPALFMAGDDHIGVVILMRG